MENSSVLSLLSAKLPTLWCPRKIKSASTVIAMRVSYLSMIALVSNWRRPPSCSTAGTASRSEAPAPRYCLDAHFLTMASIPARMATMSGSSVSPYVHALRCRQHREACQIPLYTDSLNLLYTALEVPGPVCVPQYAAPFRVVLPALCPEQQGFYLSVLCTGRSLAAASVSCRSGCRCRHTPTDKGFLVL